MSSHINQMVFSNPESCCAVRKYKRLVRLVRRSTRHNGMDTDSVGTGSIRSSCRKEFLDWEVPDYTKLVGAESNSKCPSQIAFYSVISSLMQFVRELFCVCKTLL